MKLYSIVILFLFNEVSYISTSDGDRSPYYQKCVKKCLAETCKTDGYYFKNSAQLNFWSKLLWNCRDECRYNCMWRTVQSFQERGYLIPKFHGKWPFVRVYGVQEPGSVLASLLNLAAHIYMYTEIMRRFTIKGTPLVLFWHIFVAVCINAWIWSTIFHTRDTQFTEFMDYACALSMVMGLFVAAVVRAFHRQRKLVSVILVASLLFYATHVQYLYRGIVNYDYNMMVNLAFGVAGSLVWLCWAGVQMLAGRRHAWRMGAFTVASGATLALELMDFPPLFTAWDAHALWHLATAPLPLLFYRFVIDDLYYLQSTKHSDKTNLKLT
ncbi:unnamed protein product [Chilo suppressalis]|uniref:Post-GPI attachment to proteins factor 3 n=1 Tax=Chilo suppressalis TaxID=168631 RepID=A0ABN8BHV9_CHISP|nr:unnamed protein product [Chilo suppressalis]